MRPLTAAELLDIWERGRGQAPPRQALLLLEATCSDEPPEALAALPVGRRNARLLRLRGWTFGPHLESIVACPACGERLELNVAVDKLLGDGDDELALPLVCHHDGYDVTFRLPNSLDLAEASGLPETAGERLLLERCLLEARQGEEDVMIADLPEAVVAAVADAMAAADPQADLRGALTCPACSHGWESPLDVVSYLWHEVDTWARRTLYEVHLLASAYGWHEADILAMSAWRRSTYLNLIA